MNLYEELADSFAQQIRTGVYEVGEKLPSVRGLSRQRSVSVSTVLQAYTVLEDRGLIEVKPKSGYYVKPQLSAKVLDLPKVRQNASEPNLVSSSQMVMDVMRASGDTPGVSLGAAVPAGDFPIMQQLKKTFAKHVREQPFLGIGYDSTKGHPYLRQQIAKRSMDSGVLIDADDVVVTAGCQGAIALCLRALCQPGDIVAVESPAYYGLLQLLESSGLKALEIPSDPQTGMSIEALQLALEQWPIKVILTVSSFSNPLGSLIPESNKRRLVELAQQYDIPIIEDDIYGDLYFGSERPRSIKSFDKEGRVLMCSSASKVLDPQLGLGWVLPGRYLEQIEYERFLTNTGLSSLQQRVLADVFSKASFTRHLEFARAAYRYRRDQYSELIARCFPEGVRISQPQGGFVLWLQLPGKVDANELYVKAKRVGVVVAPGAIFSSNPKKYRDFVRISYANELNAERQQALKVLGSLASALIE